MNKTELWNAVVERYPEFKDENFVVKQRARGLRRLLDQAWDEGRDAGLAERPQSCMSPFDQLFGKKFQKPY